MAIIFPSLISADVLNLQKEIERLDPHCQGYHLDVMDHHFVPNLTWGPRFINAIAKTTYKTLWVHLMVDNPQTWVNTLFLQPKSILTFHFENTKEIIHMIKHIKEKNWLASIAINPKTPVEEIFPLLNIIDQVTLMSVEPGFSGQKFLPSVISKIDSLNGYRQTSGLDFKIGLDGGINETNIKMLAEKGVDHCAIAAGIFEKDDPVEALKTLTTLI